MSVIDTTRRRFQRISKEKFRRTCFDFFSIELRKRPRNQEWVLWQVIRDVAYSRGLVNQFEMAYDAADLDVIDERSDRGAKVAPLFRKQTYAVREQKVDNHEGIVEAYERRSK